jgi:hypothetical protein
VRSSSLFLENMETSNPVKTGGRIAYRETVILHKSNSTEWLAIYRCSARILGLLPVKWGCDPFADKGDGVLGTQWIDLTSLPSGSSRMALH